MFRLCALALFVELVAGGRCLAAMSGGLLQSGGLSRVAAE